MKFPTIAISLLASLSPLLGSQDIINFKNNDTLHGEFIGFDGPHTLLWQSKQASTPIPFKTEKLRKIIFNQGLSRRPFLHSSLVTLSNGDILPCSISEIDADSIRVHTDFSKDLSIPKHHVRNCILNPIGQQILYQGPYLAENWDTLALPKANSADDQSPQHPAWEFGSFGWYNRGIMGGITLRDFKLPEAFRLRLLTESPRHSNIAIVLHADLANPPAQPDEGSSPARFNSAERITSLFGSCLTIKLSSHNATLTAYNISDNGETTYTNIKSVNGRTSIRREYGNNKTEVELRVNRPKEVISLYYQDQLVNQWSLKDIDHLPNGQSFGFLAHFGGDNYLTRISDISIAPWNGVLDSALSLESDTRDILMLSNGKERFAGKVIQLKDQMLHFEGSYADMRIPRNELQSINFATKGLKAPADSSNHSVTFQFSRTGFLNATPKTSDGSKITVSHPVLGEITLDTEYLTAISYQSGGSLLDQWNSKID